MVWLIVKCCQIDGKIPAGADTEYDGKSYLAWSNALRRALRDLGAEPTAVSAPSLADVLSQGDAA